ncbi:Lrp/AsnC family transcriptional regulator [Gordonia sp. PP30]|uniref:Lrp/AsnC family transcriptional regulator n=1 Tax=Gordonia sp. PP30 TaxID=2935861 RepID=UPI0032D5ADF6
MIDRKVFPTFSPTDRRRGKIFTMDRVDRKILAVLQEDGRLSLTDLAARVGLTVSPAHRRVRDLERSGAITGYRATVDPGVLGLGFEALVFVTMNQEDRATLLAFEREVAAVPNVLTAQRLFGDPDYLLRVRTVDMDAYARLQDEVLGVLPGVQRLTSTLVMKTIVEDRPYPTELG